MTRSVKLPSSRRVSCVSSRCERRRTSCFEFFLVEAFFGRKSRESDREGKKESEFLFLLVSRSLSPSTFSKSRKRKIKRKTNMVTHDDKVGFDGGPV